MAASLPSTIELCYGIVAHCELGPAHGAVVTLRVRRDHTQAQIEAAKAEVRRRRDVIILIVEKPGP